MDPVVLPYDASWPRVFEDERVALTSLLGSVLTTDVEHVGSTSVPGLAAKPIIDMIAGVSTLQAASSVHELLAARGYAYRQHRPEAHLFIRTDLDGVDTFHLHLIEPGSDLWIERLAFRDALRADPALAARYAEWKSEHATGNPDSAYDAVKTPFVRAVLSTRGVGLKPDEQRYAR